MFVLRERAMKTQLVSGRECAVRIWGNTVDKWAAATHSALSVCRRFATSIQRRAWPVHPDMAQPATNDTKVPDADPARAPDTETPTGLTVRRKMETRKSRSRRRGADRRAIERGENEGMAVPSK